MVNMGNVSRVDGDGCYLSFYGQVPAASGGYSPIYAVNLKTEKNCTDTLNLILDEIFKGSTHLLVPVESLQDQD